ncbi:MAG: FAD-dependent oxidoreductase, partial [Bacteroidales bacterium]|nr:FAD-dependent oxidoreductase [Bacteroidales bacterium]
DNSTPEARAETNRRGVEAMNRVVAFIRKQPGLENVEVVKAAREVGVRETCRVVGEKTITESEYLSGIPDEDALSWSYWMVDEHKAGTTGARLVFLEEGKIGSVPLKAMIPKGVGNMLVAGRAVSSDHGANSALRVQASCMGMGQAAGVVAAIAAKRSCDPRDVPLDLAKEQLSAIGHIVPSQDADSTNSPRIVNTVNPSSDTAASRAYDIVKKGRTFSFTAKSPIETVNASRILLPSVPKSVLVGDAECFDPACWDALSKTYLLTFDNNPDGVKVKIIW